MHDSAPITLYCFWEQIEEKIHFIAAIDRGLEDIKAGRLVAHEDVKKSLDEWLY